MGLDSLPNYKKDEENNKITTLDSFFRSKSMNSLHFLPDFDPTRVAFHRRARTTSASFHEQGRVNYSFVVVNDDDRVDKDTKGEMEAGSKSNNEICMCKKNKHDNDGRRVKERKSKKRYEERYYKTNSREFRNNVGENSDLLREKLVKKKGKLNGKVVTSKKKVYHKEIMCFEDDQLPSRSPVSVLDDYYKEFEFVTLYKGEGRQTKSNSRRKTSPNIKINDNLQQEIMPKSKENQQDYCNKIATKQEPVKEEVNAADYLVEMLGKICKMAEEEHKKRLKVGDKI
ncbi:uncharacterized protein LOC110710789 [Chenopodium quinoa]|uniref:uncharacterized protein LOC110710789 n=1 Tax=Chenopodium quinoa TaxID=63459 RepID=UPI000B7753F2|nr:uncharacterized protein LOC110710789 [Chenopodium quinoa]